MRINSWCGWDPLEEVWVGRHHLPEYFDLIPIQNIREPLKKIAEETEEDYQSLIKILKDYGVQKILRPEFDVTSRYGDGIPTHATNPRDHHWVYGNKLYRFENKNCYNKLYNEYEKDHCDVYNPYTGIVTPVTNHMEAPCMVRFGDAVLVDAVTNDQRKWLKKELKDTKIFWWPKPQGHRDGMFCPVKPGLIVSLIDYREDLVHKKIFEGWENLYIPNESWEKTTFTNRDNNINKMLKKTGNKWYLKDQEDNDELINFINVYLSKWVGYCAESVFDVNMLVLDQHNVIVNSYNKKIFDTFKKHKIEPIICNLRHRYFWDGGLHCNTLDIRRQGKKERYLNYAD